MASVDTSSVLQAIGIMQILAVGLPVTYFLIVVFNFVDEPRPRRYVACSPILRRFELINAVCASYNGTTLM
jgi:hypothetical protein